MRIFSSVLSLASIAFCLTTSFATDSDTRLFEMRVYYATEGKLDALHARFRDHTCNLFEKHGIQNIGYWVPMDNSERKLVYVLAFPDRESREQSWKAFLADPDWQTAYKASEVDGRLVSKVQSYLLQATDYSPAIGPEIVEGRIFELRTYTSTEGNLSALHSRFRDHTCALFEKHGMTNVAYWSPIEGSKGADDTLVYFLAHKSREAAKASFDAFRQDPDWTVARQASEQRAGGSLTTPNGVVSEFLTATDYSPLR